MALVDDGDLIRGLGYVALYAAYLEEAIDDVLEAVANVHSKISSSMKHWPISRKLKFIRRTLNAWESLPEELTQFASYVDSILHLLDQRNLFIHGRIYADPKSGDVLKPAREEYPEQPAVSKDLYDLANQLFSACNPCIRTSMFAIPRYKLSLASKKSN